MPDFKFMRLFAGLDIPDVIADGVMDTVAKLRGAAPKLRWSPRGNLHITTKFIGAWPEDRLGELKDALASVRSGPFEVEIAGLGWFPNPHSPRIFWAGAKGGEALVSLAARTDAATARLGVEAETKAYSPHVTLARVKQGEDVRALRGAVAGLNVGSFGRFEAREFNLYESKPGPAGSVYTKLAGYSLKLD